MLHGMERDGFLQSYQEVVNGKGSEVLSGHPGGKRALADSHAKVRELVNEVYREKKKRR